MALTMVLAAYLIVQIAQTAFSHDLAKHTIYRYAIGYAGNGFTLIYGYLVSSHKAKLREVSATAKAIGNQRGYVLCLSTATRVGGWGAKVDFRPGVATKVLL